LCFLITDTFFGGNRTNYKKIKQRASKKKRNKSVEALQRCCQRIMSAVNMTVCNSLLGENKPKTKK
jgi:hypothetical protein